MDIETPRALLGIQNKKKLFATEHGSTRKDEINIIQKGANYGWGFVDCQDDGLHYKDRNFTFPVFCTIDWSLAPGGAVFVKDKNHPWYNNLFVAGLQGRHVHRFIIENDTIIDSEIFYFSNETIKENTDMRTYEIMGRRIRDVAYFNGSLWVLSAEAGVAKLTPEKYT